MFKASLEKLTKMMSAEQFEFSCHWSFFSIYYSKWIQKEGENQIAQRVDSVLVHLLEYLTAIKTLPEILAPFYNTIKDQLNSEWIYEVIVSSKMPTKGFLPYQRNKNHSPKNAYTHQKIPRKSS